MTPLPSGRPRTAAPTSIDPVINNPEYNDNISYCGSPSTRPPKSQRFQKCTAFYADGRLQPSTVDVIDGVRCIGYNLRRTTYYSAGRRNAGRHHRVHLRRRCATGLPTAAPARTTSRCCATDRGGPGSRELHVPALPVRAVTSHAMHVRNRPSGACAITPSGGAQVALELDPEHHRGRNQRGAYRRGDPQNTVLPQDVTPNA